MYQNLTVRTLGPAIGAEVQNLDLTNGFSLATLKELEAVLIKHEAILLHLFLHFGPCPPMEAPWRGRGLFVSMNVPNVHLWPQPGNAGMRALPFAPEKSKSEADG